MREAHVRCCDARRLGGAADASDGSTDWHDVDELSVVDEFYDEIGIDQLHCRSAATNRIRKLHTSMVVIGTVAARSRRRR